MRVAYLAYAKALAELFCETVFVRYTQPLNGKPETLTLYFSWV